MHITSEHFGKLVTDIGRIALGADKFNAAADERQQLRWPCHEWSASAGN